MSSDNGRAIAALVELVLRVYPAYFEWASNLSWRGQIMLLATGTPLIASGAFTHAYWHPLFQMKEDAQEFVVKEIPRGWSVDETTYKFPEVDDLEDQTFSSDRAVISTELASNGVSPELKTVIDQKLDSAREDADSRGTLTGDESVRMRRSITVCHKQAINCQDQYSADIHISVEYKTKSGKNTNYYDVERSISMQSFQGAVGVNSDSDSRALREVVRAAHNHGLRTGSGARMAKKRGWGIYAHHPAYTQRSSVMKYVGL